jgi:DNA-binding LytR/AlgR family response regulator
MVIIANEKPSRSNLKHIKRAIEGIKKVVHDFSQEDKSIKIKQKISVVFLDIEINGVKQERLLIRLFDDIVPITAKNFRTLCTGAMVLFIHIVDIFNLNLFN